MVDDEPMALEVLKYVLDWNSLGFFVCGTCENGKEAIEAIDKYQPDIVITDIKMPIMDGLNLIQYAREKREKNIEFIVVSGYGEFEYAKKAMQYGVRYFLQKPIIEEDIYESIIEIKERLNKMQKDREIEEMDKKALLDSIMAYLLHISDSEKAFRYLKSFLDEDTISMGWNCIIVAFEPDKQIDNEQLKRMHKKAKEAIHKSTKGDSATFVLEQNLNTFIVLISLKNERKINSIAKKLYEDIIAASMPEFTIGVGENVLGINAVKQSYEKAMTALDYRFYKGTNNLIFYDEIKGEKFKIEFKEPLMSNKIFEAVEEADISKVRDIIDKTFQYFEIQSIDPSIVIMFTSNMIYKINKLIYKCDHKTNESADNNTIREMKEHKRTMKHLKSFFEAFCLGSCEYLKKSRNKDSMSSIEKIEAYIKENYKRNITIRELAEKVYMHPVYLGKLFTQKIGVGFNEYIHELRIQEAKRLIKETNLKNHEIAAEIGYSNYNSFLHKFQKYTGVKPTEFRNTVH